MKRWWWTVLLALLHHGYADLKGSGNISFDANGDGVADAILKQGNLGIGTLSPAANLHVTGNVAVQNGNVGIGTSSPLSSLDISGTIGFSAQTVTANTTLSGNSVVVADTSSANIAVTLPYAGNASGRTYIIKKTSASNKLWVIGGGNLIDQEPSIYLSTASSGFPFVEVGNNGSQWYVLGRSAAQISSLTTSSNLVAYYKLDESSGNRAHDATNNGYHGTLKGATGTPAWIAGKYANALDFEGQNTTEQDYKRYVDLPTNTVMNDLQEGAAYSLSAWFYPKTVPTGVEGTDNTSSYAIIMKAGWHLGTRMKSDQTFTMRHYLTGDTLVNAASGNTFAAGSWYHVVGTVSKTQGRVRIYVNGNLEGTAAFTAGTAGRDYGSNPWYLGTGWFDDTNFRWCADGLIDDARFYDYELSSGNVTELYTNDGL